MGVPLLQEWLKPFTKMGVTSFCAAKSGGGADLISFTNVGIPSVSFIPDYRDVLSIHHTASDTFDHSSME